MAGRSPKARTRKATDAQARAFAEECARMGASATAEGLAAGCEGGETVYAQMPDEERDALRKVDFSVLKRERMGFSILSEAAVRSLDRDAAIQLCLQLQSVVVFYMKLDEDMSRELGNAMELILNQREERFGRRSQRSSALLGRGVEGQGTQDPAVAAESPGQDGGKKEETADDGSASAGPSANGCPEAEGFPGEGGGQEAGPATNQEGNGAGAGKDTRKNRPKRTKGCAERVYKDAVVRHVDCELSKEKLDGMFGEGGWKEMTAAERTVTEYVFIPASVVVKVYHLHAYCASDCMDPDVSGVVRAESPVVRSRAKSPISAGLMAGVLHLRGALRAPVDRICGWLASTGLALTPQRVYENLRYFAGLFRHLIDRLWAALLSCAHIQVDETPVVCYDREKKETHRGYMWVFTTGEMMIDGRPLTLFHFAEGRDAEVLRQCLKGYKGTVGSDGYGVYHALARESGGEVKNAGCLDHFRKRLVMALRAIPNLKKMTEAERLRIPVYAIWKQLGLVFVLDRETKKLKTRKERDAYRDGTVRQAFERLAEAVREAGEAGHPEGSYTLEAIKYFQNQEEYLRVFLDDGEVASNNSKCERKIAYFGVLRGQIKMFGSFRGAEVAAVLESMEQTAQEHVSDTRLYYRFLIEQYCPFVRQQPEGTDISILEETDTFLPWSDKWKAYEKKTREEEAATLRTVCEHI